jgi:hypothetical protein
MLLCLFRYRLSILAKLFIVSFRSSKRKHFSEAE